jgi:hypothetical protein
MKRFAKGVTVVGAVLSLGLSAPPAAAWYTITYWSGDGTYVVGIYTICDDGTPMGGGGNQSDNYTIQHNGSDPC